MLRNELKREIQDRLDYVPNLLFEVAHRFIIVAAIAAAYDLTKLDVFRYLTFLLSSLLFWPIVSRMVPYPPDGSTKLGWLKYGALFAISMIAGGFLTYYTLQLVAVMINAHYSH